MDSPLLGPIATLVSLYCFVDNELGFNLNSLLGPEYLGLCYESGVLMSNNKALSLLSVRSVFLNLCVVAALEGGITHIRYLNCDS